MNLKLVLRTYSALRQLTDDESALLELLRSMNDSERELLVESLSPEKPTNRRGASKSSRQVSKSSSKSSRASGMAAAINRSLGQQRQSSKNNDVTVSLTGVEATTALGSIGTVIEEDGVLSNSGKRCIVRRGDLGGRECGLLPDHNVHHMQSARGYHPFVSASDAANVGEKLSTNGGEIASTQSIEDEEASAGVAAGGSGE